MKLFNGFPAKGVISYPAVTVGSFDGVHLGHRELLRRLRETAARKGGESTVVTFEPHPRQVLDPYGDLCLLNTQSEKVRLLEGAGVDNLIIVPFDDDFRNTSPQDFISRYLVGKLEVETLIVGYNHHFGKNKEGNYGSLGQTVEQSGFSVEMVPPCKFGEIKVSSTVIRNVIRAGDMDLAARLLGYPYFIEVVREMPGGPGEVHIPDDVKKSLPPPGEYEVRAEWNGSSFPVILTIGIDRSLHVDKFLLPGVKINLIFT